MHSNYYLPFTSISIYIMNDAEKCHKCIDWAIVAGMNEQKKNNETFASGVVFVCVWMVPLNGYKSSSETESDSLFANENSLDAIDSNEHHTAHVFFCTDEKTSYRLLHVSKTKERWKLVLVTSLDFIHFSSALIFHFC